MSIIYIQCNLQAHHSAEHNQLIECLKITHKQREQRGFYMIYSNFRLPKIPCIFGTCACLKPNTIWYTESCGWVPQPVSSVVRLSWNPARITLGRLSSAVRQIPARSRVQNRPQQFHQLFQSSTIHVFPSTNMRNVTTLHWSDCSKFSHYYNVKTEDFCRSTPSPTPTWLAPTCQMWLVSYTFGSWRSFSSCVYA